MDCAGWGGVVWPDGGDVLHSASSGSTVYPQLLWRLDKDVTSKAMVRKISVLLNTSASKRWDETIRIFCDLHYMTQRFRRWQRMGVPLPRTLHYFCYKVPHQGPTGC